MGRIVAVIPARNEAATIQRVVEAVRRFLPEVLVVDDASSDDTARRARDAGAQALTLPEHGGNSAALAAGFRRALDESCEAVVTLDADGAHDPRDLPAMLAAHAENRAALTIGNRFAPAYREDVPSPKRWANRFASFLVNQAFGTVLQDVACGLRVLRRDLLELLLQEAKSAGYGIAYEMIALALEQNWPIASAPVRVHYDGSRLLCTQRGELLDLLAVIRRHADSASLRERVGEVESYASRLEPLSVRLAVQMLCLHPVRKMDSYIFQRQDGVFEANALGPIIDLGGPESLES